MKRTLRIRNSLPMITTMPASKLDTVACMVDRLPLTEALSEEGHRRSLSTALACLPLMEDLYDACLHDDVSRGEDAVRAKMLHTVLRSYAFRVAKCPLWYEEVEEVVQYAYLSMFPICRSLCIHKFKAYPADDARTFLFLQLSSFASQVKMWHPATASDSDWEAWMESL